MTDLSEDISALHVLGLLVAPLPSSEGGCSLGHGADSVDATIEVLSTIGRASLPWARLYEGHVNAVKLIILYGCELQNREMAHRVHHNELYGVWGADDRQTVQIVDDNPGLVLSGAKRFASGSGSVTQAVIPAKDQRDRQQLLIVDVSEADRADLSNWTAAGMRASQSGRYELTGIEIDGRHILGEPGDFTKEPWFIGGIWRCAAAQLGAIEQIVEETRLHLQELDRLGDPFQLQRLGEAIMAARTARLWVRDAALKVEAEADIPASVAAAGMARLMVEQSGLEVMRLAQRSIGMAAFDQAHPVERLCRDLSVYLRQAAPDALLLNTTKQMLSLDRPLPGFPEPRAIST